MNTLHHAFWSYFFFRKKKRQTVKSIVLGGIAPDIIYYVMFLYLLVERSIQKRMNPDIKWSIHYFVHGLFEHPVVEVLRKLGHSIVIWVIAFILLMILHRGFKLTPLSGFIWGWFLHVVVDFLTHVSDAVPIFYPSLQRCYSRYCFVLESSLLRYRIRNHTLHLPRINDYLFNKRTS